MGFWHGAYTQKSVKPSSYYLVTWHNTDYENFWTQYFYLLNGHKKELSCQATKVVCSDELFLPKTFTHTEPEFLLNGKKRVSKTAGLPEDTVVRSLKVFEYSVQVESQYVAEEAALICRLQRRPVCWWGQSIQG